MRTSRSLISRAALGATIIAGFAAVTAATGVTHDVAMFGGPWISIESPVNPYDEATRGSLFLVHTFHHGAKVDLPVTAKAEGLVDGQRKSVALTLSKAAQAERSVCVTSGATRGRGWCSPARASMVAAYRRSSRSTRTARWGR